MMAPMATVVFTPKPSRPPPPGTTGVLGWMHMHLFYSWWSTVLTLVVGYLTASGLVYLYTWGIADAVWQADSRRACLDASPDGACWAGIATWFESFLYGRYPGSERWRVQLTFALLVLWVLPLLFSWVRAKSVIGATAAAVFPFLAGYLLCGGERGWLMQVLVPLGMVIFAVNWLHVATCLWTGRSLRRWLFDGTRLAHTSERDQNLIVACGCGVLTGFAAWLLADWTLMPVKTNLWGGLFVTFLIAGAGIAISLPTGIVLALARRSQMTFIRAWVIAYIELVRAVPLVAVLFFAVIMTPLFLPVDMAPNKLILVMVAVSLFSAAYMAEVVRGGLQAIPLGQIEAAQSIGLSYWLMMRLIVLPQALKHMIPNIASQYIGLLKDTTVVSIVGLYDFLLMLRVPSQNPVWIGLYIEPFVFGGVVYFLMCYSISRYSRALERQASGVAGPAVRPRS